MSGSELWVCRYCRSVNPARSGKCYRCHTPREVASARPEDLTVAHQESRPEASGTFQSSETYAVLLTVAAFALAVGTIIGTWVTVQVLQLRLAGDSAGADQLFAGRQLLLAVVPILAGLVLLAYAAWISRLVANLPALGLGYSRVSPRWAFFEPFIPGRNLYSLPARTAEVAKKLDDRDSVTLVIGLAWSLVVAPLPILILVNRLVVLFGTFNDLFLYYLIGTPITAAFLIAGLVVAVVVVWRVQRLQQARLEGWTGASSQATASSPATPPATTPPAAPPPAT
ncbi:MAG TPA: zinc finger Ran-binding domain-containing protein [Candidatus Binatus sp.]|nr:zinc finger Ran-binding domain-containing protein [Candidatus Binatus sp.]